MSEQLRNIKEIFKAGKWIDDAINKATREAVKRHFQEQHPVASWQNGQIVGYTPRI